MFLHFHNACLVLTFLLAVGRLFLLDLKLAAILLFIVPPSFAYMFSRAPNVSVWTARLAASFLVLIGVGVILAEFNLVPAWFNHFPKLPAAENRILSWYVTIYLTYLMVLLPPYAFGRTLWLHAHNEPADLSKFTCWLGLGTWFLVVLGAAIGVFFNEH